MRSKAWFLGSFGLSLAVLCTVFFAPSSVSAVSDYDESYKNTDSLMLSLDGRESIDVTLNWNGFITGTYTEKNLRYRNGNNTATEAEINAWRDSYNNKQYWSVSQSCSGNTCVVYVVWSTSNQMSLTWRTGPSWWPSVIVNDHTDIYTAELNYNTSNSNDIDVFIDKTATRRTLTMPTYPDIVVENLFAFVSDYNYPTSYEGEEIPQEIDELPIVRPDFAYSVADKNITAKDNKKDLPEFVPDEGYTFNGYEVEWSLFRGDDLIDQQIKLQETEYKFTVEEYGSYRLEARYLVQQCYRYEGYPTTPDYCFYVDLGTEFKDLDFTSTAVNLNIDGSSTSGSTALMECDIAGVCSLPAKTPAALFFNGLDNMNTFGLTQFFTAPITFLATLPAKAENCNPISFQLLGQTISIECLKPRYYEWSATVMNIYTTLLIAGTGYLIAFNVFRNIKDINTPDKDKIEVARL